MMASMWQMTILLLSLGLFLCSSFVVPPTLRHRRSTIKISMQRTAATKPVIGQPTISHEGADRRALHMTSTAQVSSDKQRLRIAATSIATVVGSTGPAHADNLAGGIAEGVRTLNGPVLLAVPIVLGFLVATAIAVFIYSFSQPREVDE